MRKSFVYAGLAAVVLTAYVLFVMPLEEKRPVLREEMEVTYATLQKYRNFVEGAADTKAEADEAAREVTQLEKGIIGAADESLAFAELHLTVQELAESAGIDLISIRPLQPVEYNGYRGIQLLMDGRADIGGVSDFLKSLDSGTRLIRLDKIDVLVSDAREMRSLRVKLQMTGLMRT